MIKYHKIETLYNRNTDGSNKLIYGNWRNNTVQFLKNVTWDFTEKIDGTNISIEWDGYNISFHGRTERAEIPKELLNVLQAKFDNNETEQLFEQAFGEKNVILFGEGYGRKIQKVGSSYIPDGVNFILFDVMIGGNYQPRSTVEDIAKSFNIDVAPIVLSGTLFEAERFICHHPKSFIGNCYMEGVVGRPQIELQDRCGNRIIVKIKYEDYKELFTQ